MLLVFSGIPKVVLYGQDRVFFVHKNHANNHICSKQVKTSHESFLEKTKLLRSVSNIFQSDFEYYIVYRNAIKYKYGIYEMPLGFDGKEVKVETDGVNVIFKDRESDEVIVDHSTASAQWQIRL